ncbi:hypothetical protein GCM10009759_07900 [Kitasatospora saccharophila]|uniref:Uncharacterized protein n=1 Tax=Kitasatospora saccharophila TaxID=407973 RepID=A0ABN2W9L8_9ACTN
MPPWTLPTCIDVPCTVPDMVLSTRIAELSAPSATPIVPTLSAPAPDCRAPRATAPRPHGPRGCQQTATVLEINLPNVEFGERELWFASDGNRFRHPVE